MKLHLTEAAALVAGLAIPLASHAYPAPPAEIARFLGTTLAHLEAINPLHGTVDSNGRAGVITSGVALRRTLSVQRGDVLSFDWFFGTDEVVAGDGTIDFALFGVDGTLVPLAFTTEATESTAAGLYSSPFAHHLPPHDDAWFRTEAFTFEAPGEHLIGFAILDTVDSAVRSGLLLDRVRLNGVLLDGGGFEAGEMEGIRAHYAGWQMLGDAAIWNAWPFAPEGNTAAALVSGSFAPRPVPLPAALWLFGTALGTLARRDLRDR